MSRTHLYRGGRSSRRPLFSVILGSAWCGAALAALVAAMPAVGTVVPAGAGPADERFAFVLAVGGMLVGLMILVRELLAGRTLLRGARLGGASLLALAATVGALDLSRDSLRPAGVGDLNAAELSTPTADDGGAARRRIAWSAAGLLGALLVVAAGTAALRSREQAI
jgi:hypothetical protein